MEYRTLNRSMYQDLNSDYIIRLRLDRQLSILKW